MTVVINEPQTRENLAFKFITLMTTVVTDPTGEDTIHTGRELVAEERETYDSALILLNKHFTTGADWFSHNPLSPGLYLFAHTTKACVEIFVVGSEGMAMSMYHVTDKTFYQVNDLRGFWFGPLPFAPNMRA